MKQKTNKLRNKQNCKEHVPCSMFHVPCYRAFSLLELLIAMFIFVLIITTVIATFGKMFKYNKTIRATETNMEEVGTAFELMAKTMRMSSKLVASGSSAIYMYNNSQGICVSYRFNASNLEMATSGSVSDNTQCGVGSSNYGTYTILAKNISSGKFAVTPTSTSPTMQIGKATIMAKLTDGNIMQTSVSFRDYMGTIY
jgi:Tfp pilus assembly protein PilV